MKVSDGCFGGLVIATGKNNKKEANAKISRHRERNEYEDEEVNR